MTKKHFIALANAIRGFNHAYPESEFSYGQMQAIADVCKASNFNFNRERWLSYIAGEREPNGGTR